jgi:Protein of unknown function (DUF4236)
MGFRFRRSIKLLPGVRPNLGKRGILASIGASGPQVTFGRTGTRATVGLPGSGPSYTPLDKPHHERVAVPTTHFDPDTSPGSHARGILWIALITVVLIAAVLVHLGQP